VLSFLPLVLYAQFRFFFNLYFLLVALSQFFPPLRTGFLVTYIAPLAFVLAVTMGKEALDDYARSRRDAEANAALYTVLSTPTSPSHASSNEAERKRVPAAQLRVGTLVLLEKNARVPADLLLLRTSDASGTCFVRTDQLDGETDWKLRVAVPSTQAARDDAALRAAQAEVYGASASALPVSFGLTETQRRRRARTCTRSSAPSPARRAAPSRSARKPCSGRTRCSRLAARRGSWCTPARRRARG